MTPESKDPTITLKDMESMFAAASKPHKGEFPKGVFTRELAERMKEPGITPDEL